MNHLQKQLIRLGHQRTDLRTHIRAVVDHLASNTKLHTIRQQLVEEGEDLSEEQLFDQLEKAFNLFLAAAPKIEEVSQFKFWYDPEEDLETLRGSEDAKQEVDEAIDAFGAFSAIVARTEDLLELVAMPYDGMLLDGATSPFQMVNGLSIQFGEAHDAFLGLTRDPVKDEESREAVQEQLSDFASAIEEAQELYDEFVETREFLEGLG